MDSSGELSSVDAATRAAARSLASASDAILNVDSDARLGLEGERLEDLRRERPSRSNALASVAIDGLANRIALLELRTHFYSASRALAVGARLTLVARDPAWVRSFSQARPWPGSEITTPSGLERFRPLRHYDELGRLYGLAMETPIHGDEHLVAIPFERVSTHGEFHGREAESAEERYGSEAAYQRFDRLEEPEIADDLCYAASRLRPRDGERILSIGVNDGRELDAFRGVLRPDSRGEVWGIDVAPSALLRASRRPPLGAGWESRWAVLDAHDLERALGALSFDVILMLGVLQLRSIDRDAILAQALRLAHSESRFLVSVPNCHFGTHDVLRRPVDRHDPRHDRTRVLKDLRYYSRYFYRAGYRRIENFGTYDLFLLVRP